MTDSVERPRPRNPLAEWVEKHVGVTIDGQSKDGVVRSQPEERVNTRSVTPPPGWPSQVPISQTDDSYQDWSEYIEVSPVLVALPRDASDVVAVCNFAANNLYKVRAKGRSHNWSPLSFPPPGFTQSANTVLIDTSSLNTMSGVVVGQGTAARLQASFGTGVTLADATQFIEQKFKNPLGPSAAPGFTFSNMPAPGKLTLGGILAIGGHGTSVPWNTTETEPGLMGCLSNLIKSFTAVVYESGQYQLKPFDRTDQDAPAFMVHLGRAFITEVTLVAIPNYWVDTISQFPDMNDVMADPPQSDSAFCNLIEAYGRVEGDLVSLETRDPALRSGG